MKPIFFLIFCISLLLSSGCDLAQPSTNKSLPNRMGIFLVEGDDYVILNQGNSNLQLNNLPITSDEHPNFAVIGLVEHLPFITLHAITENGFGNETGFSILMQEGYAQIELDSSIELGLYCFTSYAPLGDQITLTWCFSVKQEFLELDKFEPSLTPSEPGLHLMLEDTSEQLVKQSSFVITEDILSTDSSQPVMLMNMEGVSLTQLQLVKIIAGLGFRFDERDDLIAVRTFLEQSSAQDAGLETGDVFLAVDGQSVPPDKALSRDLIVGEPGTTLNLTILRGNKTMEFEATRNTILEYIPIAVQFATKDDYLLVAPSFPLSTGMYCYVSEVVLESPRAGAYWCFHIN